MDAPPMIARFSDHKALSLAYSDLIDLGIPRHCISPCFEEAGPEPQEPAVHRSFLEELHRWFASRSRDSSPDAYVDAVRLSSRFRKHGGVLRIECGSLGAQTLQVLLQHNAELVG